MYFILNILNLNPLTYFTAI